MGVKGKRREEGLSIYRIVMRLWMGGLYLCNNCFVSERCEKS